MPEADTGVFLNSSSQVMRIEFDLRAFAVGGTPCSWEPTFHRRGIDETQFG